MLLAAAGFAAPVHAQTARPHQPISSLDAYGANSPRYTDRRIFTDEPSLSPRPFTRSYAQQGRRRDERLGFYGLSLPGQYGAIRSPGLMASIAPIDPLVQPTLGEARRRTFAQYGGFGERFTDPREEGALAAIRRRHELIEATGMNAPVYRALDRTTGFASVRPPPETGAVTNTFDPVSPTVRPDRQLRGQTDRSQARVRAEAWDWFHSGRYRQSARAFETALMIEPRDGESRIGQVLCYYSLGAIRSAVALVAEAARDDADPFQYSIAAAALARSPDEARRLRVEVQLLAEAARGHADLSALRVIVLWYLGDRGEARVVAGEIRRKHATSPFAAWIDRMSESARTVPGLDSSHN